MNTYKPQVGDSVVARRRIKVERTGNLIIGPITAVSATECQITTNPNEDFHKTFFLPFKDWTFEFLHKTVETPEIMK